MSLLASTVSSSTLKFQLERCKLRAPAQLCRRTALHQHIQVSPRCSMKTIFAEFGEPDKIYEQAIVIKDRLLESIPKPVKDFPWKKAEDVTLQRLLSLAEKALKWSFVAWFILGFLSDFMASIATNQELVVPFGLLIGCLISDFLKETMQEILRNTEGRGLKNLQFSGTICFFVFVKFVSVFFRLRTLAFLLHVGNGGILQTLWQWRRRLTENEES